MIKHLVRDEGVAGSNPATPTNFLKSAIITGPDMGNETAWSSSKSNLRDLLRDSTNCLNPAARMISSHIAHQVRNELTFTSVRHGREIVLAPVGQGARSAQYRCSVRPPMRSLSLAAFKE